MVQGTSSVDESTITGESLPRDKQTGDEVFSGTLNGHGMLVIEVTRAGQETTLARVIALVEQAKEKKAPVERLADRYARYFLPALALVAGTTFYFTRDWLRTVSVLIVACPCALVLATPAAMVAAIGGLARRGILVRGASVLESASKIDMVLFDKTGTVTEGRFTIVKIVTAGSESEDELLALAAAAGKRFGPYARPRDRGRGAASQSRNSSARGRSRVARTWRILQSGGPRDPRRQRRVPCGTRNRRYGAAA